ncbi:Crp/Fnr family transcriptional regulator [Kitasatospora sp. NBC_01300]|uniref:Crp/Fnr family transcriptional regulator n=1 Tax=Kitasatospora sp. NBC_01300 TaxID=2903574 RepID=UPI002F908A48|nr:Crp/Fnr family transcriptional regulator [Kitasatospora sp. NBC_01300]
MTDTGTPGLDPVLEALFTAKGTLVRFTAGETLIHQGDPTDGVLALRTGAVKVLRHGDSDDTEIVVALREPPETVGDHEAIAGGPRTSSVVALTDGTALAVPGSDLRALVDTDPAAALALYRIVSKQRRDADQAYVEQLSHTVTQRAAARLLALMPRLGVTDEATGAVSLQLSQPELAQWVGASREAIVRTLRQLRKQGALTTNYGAIVIHDLEALRAAVPA